MAALFTRKSTRPWRWTVSPITRSANSRSPRSPARYPDAGEWVRHSSASFCSSPSRRATPIEPGTTVDQSNVVQVKDLLPPEVYAHFKKGEYANKLFDFPNSRWSWDDGFAEATKWNAEHLVLDEHKSPIDKDTKKRPDYIRGLPFPDIREDDPAAGYKALWNLDYAYYTGGNSHNLTLLNWVSRSGVDRASVP